MEALILLALVLLNGLFAMSEVALLTAQALTEAFRRGGTETVRSLYRNKPADDSCWFAGNGWWLSVF